MHLSPQSESPMATWQPIHFSLPHSASFYFPTLLLTYLEVKFSFNWLLTCFCWCCVTCYQPLPFSACAMDRKLDTSQSTLGCQARKGHPEPQQLWVVALHSPGSTSHCVLQAWTLKSKPTTNTSTGSENSTFIPFHLCLKTLSSVWSQHALPLFIPPFKALKAQKCIHLPFSIWGIFLSWYSEIISSNKLLFICNKWRTGIQFPRKELAVSRYLAWHFCQVT